MLRVGLTGGIATGKSTVSRMLAARGIPVLDSDRLAREAVAPGSEALAEIVAAFGEGVLAPGGGLDRPRLARLIFSDPAKKKRLEEILHPRIMAAQDRWLAGLEARGEAPVAVVDAALMVESGGWRRFDVLVVVDCEEAQQIQRLRERGGLDEAAARARLGAQMPVAEKVKFADWVVDNRGTLEQTERQVGELVSWLLARSRPGGGKKARKRD